MPVIQLFKEKPLTRLELHEISMRIKELSSRASQTDDNYILEKIWDELDQLEKQIKKSIKAAERLERLSI